MQFETVSETQISKTKQLFTVHSPLIHCMTNDVVQTFTANILLAIGCSPAMVIEPEEAEQFAAIADGVLINVGTLTSDRQSAMRLAVYSARHAQKPWVLDPVAVGALQFRTQFCRELLKLTPTAIRGNASEIMALAGSSQGGRGVDSLNTPNDALPAAQALAREVNTMIVISGEVDYVTDGHRTIAITGGHPIMTRVVGTGCGLSAAVTAACALPGDRLLNIANTCAIMKQAGEIAKRNCRGTGSFIPEFLDALSQ
ncbi:hydroxyethylthiazole kinase [Providencia sp. 21OH12SH02B-Prov]|uniref:hydroxyethylthiazole kinase n=1 Tax=Providencia TaxID=586 RepID=UPI0013A71B9B|nr:MULTISPECIES: hydroxyethylthiazole kinase [Providencia]QIC17680.1 hydroxyethylthiazole kinase [Providencia vermicola]WBA57124.1 hydroxyethylthiazole kinase [Providencia sp. 21OH12SH02B-Prov]